MDWLLRGAGLGRLLLAAASILFAWLPFERLKPLLVQKPIFIARMWSFLLPLAAVWAAQGLLAVLALLNNARLRTPLLSLFLTAAALSCVRYYVVEHDTFKLEIVGDEAQDVVAFIKPDFEEGDIFVVSPQADAKHWYVFERFGLPQDSIRNAKLRAFERVFVLTYPGIGETLPDVVEAYGPGVHLLDMDSTEIVIESAVFHLYSVVAAAE